MPPTSRSDSRVLEILLLAFAALVVIVGVLPGVFGKAGLGIVDIGPAMTVDVTLDTKVVVPEAPTGDDGQAGHQVELTGPYDAEVRFPSPTPMQRTLYVLSRLLPAALVLAGVLLLLQIVRSVRRGDPFDGANSRRLATLAVLVVAGGLGGSLVYQLVDNYLLISADVDYITVMDLSFSLLPVLAGFGILVLAEVFRQGTRLRDDVDGLV